MIRVLHLIDSLAPGGAERVAVNLANELNNTGQIAWLCATRAEGMLHPKIEYPERYLFLNKHSALDLRALARLIQLVRRENIELIHAHSSSIYWGVLVKWATRCKLVWHDHSGERAHVPPATKWLLQVCSLSMDGLLSVNQSLAKWSAQHLWIAPHKIRRLNHFATLSPVRQSPESDTLRILCLANIRPQKDHQNLLRALQILSKTQSEVRWEVFLVGMAADLTSQQSLEKMVAQAGLRSVVHFVGPQQDVETWLSTCQIGILASRSEGLPVALLEYGLAGLAVVCTDVGACSEVLEAGKNGLLVPPENSEALADALARLLQDAGLRRQLGDSLQANIRQHYSVEAALTKLYTIYRDILN